MGHNNQFDGWGTNNQFDRWGTTISLIAVCRLAELLECSPEAEFQQAAELRAGPKVRQRAVLPVHLVLPV